MQIGTSNGSILLKGMVL